jgi:hypothetical protein
MIFFIFLLISLFVSLVAQHFIPVLPWLYGARVFLMPLIFFYGAMAMPFWAMLGLAFCSGLMWDALNAQVLSTGTLDPRGGTALAVEISIGWSIILYATLGSVMNGFRPLFLRGRGWMIHCLISGPFVAFMVLAEYLMLTFRRGDFLFPPVIWWRIAGTGMVAMILAPFVYFTLDAIAPTLGFETRSKKKEAR